MGSGAATTPTLGMIRTQIEQALTKTSRVELTEIAHALSVECIPILRLTCKGSTQPDVTKALDLLEQGAGKIFEALELLAGGEHLLQEYVFFLCGHRGSGLTTKTTEQSKAQTGVSISIPTGNQEIKVALNDAPIRSNARAQGDLPSPELTYEERAEVAKRQYALERQYPDDLRKMQEDPDKVGTITLGTQEEARVALDLREQGKLPWDVARPDAAAQGDFQSRDAEAFYDLKGLHSNWPVFSSVKNKLIPFPQAYQVKKNQTWIRMLQRQIVEEKRTVILDTRNAKQEAIDDLASIIEQKGWSNYVIWYP